MLQVSDDAITLLKEALDSERENPEDVFRLTLEDNRLSLALNSSQPGDVVYDKDGYPVLAAPPEIAEGLDTRTINIEESDDGPRLVITE